MPRSARHASALVALALLFVLGCGATALPRGGEADARGPAISPPDLTAIEPTNPGGETSLVLLEPHQGDTPFSAFRLVNKNPDPIRGARHWPGLFGTIERLGLDDVFRAFPPPQGYCLTVSAQPELAPSAATIVSELPLMGGERILPPGRYRFVVPHLRDTYPDKLFAATLAFDVHGLDPTESEELVRLLDRDDVRACPLVASYLLDTIERSAAPEALPRLESVHAETLDERARIYTVLAHFPEHVPRLATIAAGTSSGSLAAAVVLLEEGARGAALTAAVTRIALALATPDEPPIRIIDALAREADEWPPEIAPRLVARLLSTRSPELRLSLATALSAAGKEVLGKEARPAVKAMRAAARSSADARIREALLDMAAALAETLGDESPRERPGRFLQEKAELGGAADDPCHILFQSLRPHPLLRHTPAAWPHGEREPLRTTFGASGVELYRPAKDE
ncbi:hypothetical protein [Polyangium sp. y55x31]|uniref:hypothetical protein n=1 Tax=Polyangium sp. y55x31 TaxID=3042688 RepID=UPI0024823713|nr:hypothetical protein [Polyangium sp. y55x31]MDI1481585.1 hypothetical protein [Polyangium sp. y55x31]